MSQATETEHALTVQVRVKDIELCVQEAKDFFRFKTDLRSPEAAIYAFLVNPSTTPADSGYEVLEGGSVTLDGDMATLTIKARVFDAAALHKEAAEAYLECWGSSIDEQEPNIETWLYEVLVASNASPSPSDAGYEIIGMARPAPALLDEPDFAP